ncbi:hypothetical protein OIV36_31490, partial [Burkholderia pseudomallei]|uniref:hypothetical protein n=1 Tax=Burkholderia pseudomallei TaxID=28450 RepID=UPI0021F72700
MRKGLPLLRSVLSIFTNRLHPDRYSLPRFLPSTGASAWGSRWLRYGWFGQGALFRRLSGQAQSLFDAVVSPKARQDRFSAATPQLSVTDQASSLAFRHATNAIGYFLSTISDAVFLMHRVLLGICVLVALFPSVKAQERNTLIWEAPISCTYEHRSVTVWDESPTLGQLNPCAASGATYGLRY